MTDNVEAWMSEQDTGTAVAVEERPPRIDSESVKERAKAFMRQAKDTVKNPLATDPDAVSTRKTTRKTVGPPRVTNTPRKSVERLFGRAWGLMAQVVQPINIPVSRILAIQSPVAALILEDVVKGTVVDKLLQPVARGTEKAEIVYALMGPPIIVGALTARPEMQNVLVPLLKDALRTWLDVAGPKIEELAKREKEYQEKYGTQIDDILAMVFAPPEGMTSDTSTE